MNKRAFLCTVSRIFRRLVWQQSSNQPEFFRKLRLETQPFRVRKRVRIFKRVLTGTSNGIIIFISKEPSIIANRWLEITKPFQSSRHFIQYKNSPAANDPTLAYAPHEIPKGFWDPVVPPQNVEKDDTSEIPEIPAPSNVRSISSTVAVANSPEKDVLPSENPPPISSPEEKERDSQPPKGLFNFKEDYFITPSKPPSEEGEDDEKDEDIPSQFPKEKVKSDEMNEMGEGKAKGSEKEEREEVPCQTEEKRKKVLKVASPAPQVGFRRRKATHEHEDARARFMQL